MMRIPDFPQLHGVRSLRNGRRCLTKFDRGRLSDEAEIQNSKGRMRWLGIWMPLEHEKREQEQKARLARLLKENLEHSKVIDNAFDIRAGFSYTPHATSIWCVLYEC